MRLQHLRLHQFRAHAETAATFAPKLNLLHGPNGAGKTNVLEAVHYLCLSKSFLSATDAHPVQHGASFFEVEGVFESDRGMGSKVRLAYVPSGGSNGERGAVGKRAFVNGVALERLADLVGRFPVVVLSPADLALTAGGPEERRRFLDGTLSQAYPVYLNDLLKYRRALKQRNALLQQVRRGGSLPAGTLAAWDAELVALGARLIWRRQQFLDGFARFLSDAFHLLDLPNDAPSAAYETVAEVAEAGDEAAIAERFLHQLSRVARRERERGRTLVGPHLDEVAFRLNGFDVRPYASQGQHRLFGLALRLATFFFLRERLEETPLLLLDDVFGPFDTRLALLVLDLLCSEEVGQSLVTAARIEGFAEVVPFGGVEHLAFAVMGSRITAGLHANPSIPEATPASAPLA